MAATDNPATGTARLAEAYPTDPRLIGRHRGNENGPLLLCVAGLHGNEPAGIEAVLRVLAELQARRPVFRGDFVGLAGNLAALARGCRFVDEDLNRVWQRERVDAVRAARDGSEAIPSISGTEGREQAELLVAIDEALGSARGETYILDLHTTSSESCPFATFGDTLPNRALALEFPVPVVLGLEEQIDGALLEHLDQQGLIGVGIEGGSHRSPGSIDAIESVLWLALAAVGCITQGRTIDLTPHRLRLAGATRQLPRVMEVRYRHVIAPPDRFHMHPGFENFEPVQEGEVVGSDRNGEVSAPETGRIFMPLYQEQGDDGFFVVRPVRRVWLRISTLLRRLRVYALAPLLPGVHRHPSRTNALILRPWAAEGAITDLLHLLGFTKRHEGDETLMIRRKRDRPVRLR